MRSDEVTRRGIEARRRRNTPPRTTGPGPEGGHPFPPDTPANRTGPDTRDGKAADAPGSASTHEQGSPSPSRISNANTISRWGVPTIVDEYGSADAPVVCVVANAVELVRHVRRSWRDAWNVVIEVIPPGGYKIAIGADKGRKMVARWKPAVVILDSIEPDEGLRGSAQTFVIASQGKRTRPRPKRRKPIVFSWSN